MIRIVLISILAGALAWYGIAYAKFGDATVITNLRNSHRESQHSLETIRIQNQELVAQNDILKSKWKQLLEQNQDYSTMIGQLSRYYYHIQKASKKLAELHAVLDIEDDDLPAKLGSIPWTSAPTRLDTTRLEWVTTLTPPSSSDKRFF